MDNFRMTLVGRMTKIYGLENPIVINFCHLVEDWAAGEEWNTLLETIVKAHEEFPIMENEDW